MQVVRDFGPDNSKDGKPILNNFPETKDKMNQNIYFSMPPPK